MENSFAVIRQQARRWLTTVGLAGLLFALGLCWLKKPLATLKPPLSEPQTVLRAVYQDANEYFTGDTVALVANLDTYCSQHLLKAFKQVPGLMVYTFARETRNGRLRQLSIVSQHYSGADSAQVKAQATYLDGAVKTFEQHFIREGNQWKLGLKYGHGIP
ncbi:hypothetical protein GCM10027347_60520 [Larkinella harenae]